MPPPDRTPEELVQTTHLSPEQKIERLRRWSYDVRERMVASEEGMNKDDDNDPTLLRRIHSALRELGAEDVASGPTKHGA